MAIDSAAKRRSAATTSVAWGPASVTPDNSKPVEWRQSAGWGYEGIAVEELFSEYWELPAQTWAKAQPGDEAWAKSQPSDGTWVKTQPDDETWSAS